MNASIIDFGAKSDGSNSANSIQECIDQVANFGGGKVTVPAGEFMTGPFMIKSNIELHLEEGSKLIAAGQYEDYPANFMIDQITNGLISEYVLPKRAWIIGYQANNIRITGPGIVDGNADAFIENRGDVIHSMRAPIGSRSQYLERPFTIFLIDCQSVQLREFSIENPAFWALRLSGCDNAEIDGIKILTDMKVPNADGIDIDRCENVKISNSHFETADDCISIKSCSGTEIYGDTANIEVTGCYFRSASGAITLGTESAGDIRNFMLTDCVMEDSHRGFAVRAREGGIIENVIFKNSKIHTRAYGPQWWGHGEALHVTAASWDHPNGTTDGNPERLLEGKVSNITFENLQVTTEAGILVWAQRQGLINGVTFKNVNMVMKSEKLWPPRIDLRPNGYQDLMLEPHRPLNLINASNVEFENVNIEIKDFSPEFFNPEPHIENIQDYKVTNLKIM